MSEAGMSHREATISKGKNQHSPSGTGYFETGAEAVGVGSVTCDLSTGGLAFYGQRVFVYRMPPDIGT